MSVRGWLVDRLILRQPRLRRWLTVLREGDRDIDVSLFHTRIRINSIREHGYLRASRLAATSSFHNDEAPVLMTMAALLAHADGFVDAGANVGIYSKILHRIVALRPTLEFHAVEADPLTAARLRATLADTGVQVHNAALAETSGKLRFVRGAVSHVSTRASLAESCHTGEAFEIDAVRLDELPIAGQRLVLKIDVEGQEWSVLRGAEKLFAARRVAAVFVDGHKDGAAIATYVRSQGFNIYDARTLAPSPNGIPYALLAIRSDLFSASAPR